MYIISKDNARPFVNNLTVAEDAAYILFGQELTLDEPLVVVTPANFSKVYKLLFQAGYLLNESVTV